MNATTTVKSLKQDLREAHDSIALQAQHLADTRALLRVAEDRLEELDEIIQRKNTIIALLVMGDLSAEEIKLSNAASVAILPPNLA